MIFFFRVDVSDQIGLGHFMRCFNLAKQLHVRGANVRFICQNYRNNQFHLLKKMKIPLVILPLNHKNSSRNKKETKHFSDFNQKDDALKTISIIKDYKNCSLIVDNYYLGFEWEKLVYPFVEKLIVIDDLANRKHLCDIIIDQNYSNGKKNQYDTLVPRNCDKLLGPDFALIHDKYSNLKKTYNEKTKAKKILISFGGADLNNMTGLTLEALSSTEFKDIEISVVASKNHIFFEQIKEYVNKRPNTRLYDIQPDLIKFFVESSFAIGGGGTTTWERLCIGIPTLVFCLAENQKLNIQALCKDDYIFYGGEVDKITTDKIIKKIQYILKKKSYFPEISNKGKLLVDGLGAMRSAELILQSTKDRLIIRKANMKDINIYYKWINDPVVRLFSKDTKYIKYKEHREWFIRSINDSSIYLFMLLANNLPIGQIRFNLLQDKAVIDYSIDKLFRGKGLSKELVSKGIYALNETDPFQWQLYAEVKKNNKASSTTFLKLGFYQKNNADRELKTFTLHTSEFVKKCKVNIHF